MLTLTWGNDILFEKSTPETEGWIWKTPFSLSFWGWQVHVKPVLAWRQVNRLGVGGNFLCCLVIVVIFMGLGGAKM